MQEVRHALVRNSYAPDFKRLFSGKHTTAIPDSVAGWTAFLDVAVQPTSPGALTGTSLERVWLLQRGLPVTRLKVVGGIRIEGSWLGSKEVLPKIAAHGMKACGPNPAWQSRTVVGQTSDGLWSLPMLIWSAQ
jgi:hypothetical protein